MFYAPSEPDTAVEESWWKKAASYIVGSQDDWVDLHRRSNVPIFYSGKPEVFEGYTADGITLAAGVVFGAIHCIAWYFEFSSSTQAFIWRLSSLSITLVPVLLFAAVAGAVWLDDMEGLGASLLYVLFYLSVPLSGLLYVAARVATLVIALMNLSSLPPGAFQVVHWTNLVPHV